MKKMDESVRFVKNVWALTKSYWQSEEKKKAYLLLLAIIALTLGVVFMLVQLNQWYNIFYSALQNYEKEKIFSELFHFSWLAFIYIILAVYAFYLQQVLIINWRRWLTNEYIDEWLNHKTYYRLQMFGTATVIYRVRCSSNWPEWIFISRAIWYGRPCCILLSVPG